MGKKERSVVMITRKTEMRVRVSVSLKGQGGQDSCRHGKMMQNQAQKESFNFWNIYMGFGTLYTTAELSYPLKTKVKSGQNLQGGMVGCQSLVNFPQILHFIYNFSLADCFQV